jgi:hypothetical protein
MEAQQREVLDTIARDKAERTSDREKVAGVARADAKEQP